MGCRLMAAWLLNPGGIGGSGFPLTKHPKTRLEFLVTPTQFANPKS
jgi:hypothetical protein